MGPMDKVSFGNVVGFVLAFLLALVIGVSMWALINGEYMNTPPDMKTQAEHTLRIVGFAGALAALVTWWVQSFAAKRGFVVRTLFALFIFVVAFFSFGGLLRLVDSYYTRPNLQDWSVSGLYFASINDFYSFVLFMLVPLRVAFVGLTVASAIYIAWFGPREAKTADF
jgi:hypothetical protein